MQNQKVTMDDIAAKAGVSKMTVSRVINNHPFVSKKTADNINRVMKELDYHPNLIAQSLSSQKAMTIGVIIPKTTQLFLDNYIAQVLSGITDIAQQKNYRILLMPFDPNDVTGNYYISLVKSRLIDGIILLKTKIDDPFIDDLAEFGFPFILVNNKRIDKKVSFIDSENVKGAKQAVNYLYSKGHKKIAFIAGSMDETNAKDRFIGYKEALKSLGLPFHQNYVVYGEFCKDKAYKEVGKLLELKNRPTAIFSSDDYMAIGAIEKIKNAGLSVPNDIAIVGFDDIEIGSFTQPSLTTIQQPMYQIGKQSFENLLLLMNNKKKAPIRIMLKTELIIRDSV